MPSSACKKNALDRKSTRLNSSHTIISYAVFCLKKKFTDGDRLVGGRTRGAAAASPAARQRRTTDPPHAAALGPERPRRSQHPEHGFFFLRSRDPPNPPPFPYAPLSR